MRSRILSAKKRERLLHYASPQSVPLQMSKFIRVQWSFKSSFEWLAFKRIASQVQGTLILQILSE